MNIVKVFAESGFSQGVQFFDDPTGLSGFAVPVADLADVLGLEVKGLISLISDEYLCLSQKQPDLLLVIEYGVYEALSRTRSKVAKPFQTWLVKEVIPSIRKTGGYNQQKLTPYQQKLIDYTTGHAQLQADLVERCVIYHTPALMPTLPRINPAPTVDLVLAEQARSGLELDRCDVVMRDLLQAECLRQIESDGAIKTGEVWARINDGASHDDPNERRSLTWVADEIEELLPYWDMGWTGKSRTRAVKWWRSAK